MTIARFFDRNVIVKRLRDGVNNRQSFQATATVEGHIQELGAEAGQLINAVTGRAWEAWFELDAPIQEGDRIQDARGVNYYVKEVTRKDYGINQHLEVILTEHNE